MTSRMTTCLYLNTSLLMKKKSNRLNTSGSIWITTWRKYSSGVKWSTASGVWRKLQYTMVIITSLTNENWWRKIASFHRAPLDPGPGFILWRLISSIETIARRNYETVVPTSPHMVKKTNVKNPVSMKLWMHIARHVRNANILMVNARGGEHLSLCSLLYYFGLLPQMNFLQFSIWMTWFWNYLKLCFFIPD